jgi:FAD/FMN-containing dehydrogenase
MTGLNGRRQQDRKGEKTMDEILAELGQIVGDKSLVCNAGDMARFIDEPRKKFPAKPAAVVLPKTTDEVSQIIKLANRTGTAIVPQGGNTGLVGGQVTDQSGRQVILCLERMKAICKVDADQQTMIVEAGASLASAQRAADDAGLFLPLGLASQGTCTIGGNLATNAGGLNVVAYGSAREMCLGLEVVLGDGRIWNGLNTLRKNNTGYDLKNLFIGAEGTLGIITTAALKLLPAINSRTTAFIALSEPAQALQLLNLAQSASGQRVTTIELLPAIGLAFTQKYRDTRNPFDQPHPWYVLLELSSSQGGDSLGAAMQDALSAALEKGIAEEVVIAQSEQQRQQFWAIRELLPETQKFEGASIKHDISVPLNKIPEFLERANKAVLNIIPDARPVPFGHVGDGNIHFNITQPVGADGEKFLARWDEVNTVVHAVVSDLEGSISAEHGIGQLKRQLMPDIKSDVELQMMKGLKQLFDPNGILNPGKLLP